MKDAAGKPWEIIRGDALKIISLLPNATDAIIGPALCFGRQDAARKQVHDRKYSSMGVGARPPLGDAKDQRSWTRWAAEWLSDARKVCKEGAPVCVFIDWRQYPL